MPIFICLPETINTIAISSSVSFGLKSFKRSNVLFIGFTGFCQIHGDLRDFVIHKGIHKDLGFARICEI